MLPHFLFGQFTSKHSSEDADDDDDDDVIFKYNRSIHRIKVFLHILVKKPCAFFFKSCPVGNLRFENVFRYAVPIYTIDCLNKYTASSSGVYLTEYIS